MVREISKEQHAAFAHEGMHFRYRTHRVDPKEDTTRDLIESSDGNVARLVLYRGQPLTQEENDGERHRLEKLLNSGELGRKQKEELKTRSYALELIQAMPDAMLFTATAGQPQLPGFERRQIVADFVPNPAHHPHTIVEGLLDGLSGRLWIDQADHHLVRMEISISHDLTLAWGMLIKVYKGGTIVYEQQRVAEGVYCFSHIQTHLRLREFMVRTAPYESDLTAFDIQPLAAVPTGAEAIRTLLNENVPTK